MFKGVFQSNNQSKLRKLLKCASVFYQRAIGIKGNSLRIAHFKNFLCIAEFFEGGHIRSRRQKGRYRDIARVAMHRDSIYYSLDFERKAI